MDHAAMATARVAEQPPGMDAVQTVTLAAAGTGVLALGFQYVKRLVTQDSARQAAMEDELHGLRIAVNELNAKWRVCEAQRESMAEDLSAIKTLLENSK